MSINKKNNIVKPEVSCILIICCTYKRPLMLKKALESINTTDIPEDIKTEVLVIDNDAEGSASTVAEEIKQILKLPVHYVIEPKRGLSNARNRSLEEAVRLGASHIVMFDDDEFFDKNCIKEQLKMYKENENAYIISGPVPSVFNKKYPSYITKNIVFKMKPSKKTGIIKPSCAAGNVFMPVAPVIDNGLRFSTEYTFMGGEDGEFFARASCAGYTIVWCNEAIIYETVSEARANIPYLFKKSFYNGFAGAFSRFKNKKSVFSKLFYIIKNIFVCIITALISVPGLIFGLWVFFNLLCMSVRSFGKISGAIKSKPVEFYKNVYGE